MNTHKSFTETPKILLMKTLYGSTEFLTNPSQSIPLLFQYQTFAGYSIASGSLRYNFLR